MQATIDARELSKALATLKPLMSGNNMPILGSVVFSVGDGKVTVTASDLGSYLTLEIPARNTMAGAACIPLANLATFARGKGAPGVTVETVVTEAGVTELRLVRGGITVAAYGSPVAEYPSLPEPLERPVPLSTDVTDGAGLAEALESVAYAASTDGTRYNLNGVYLHSIGQVARAVATDGHRLAVTELPGVTFNGLSERGAIIPMRAVSRIVAIGKRAERISIAFDGLTGYAVTGTARLSFRCIDGDYPSYRQVIPGRSDTSGTVTGDAGAIGASVASIPWPKATRVPAVKLTLNGAVLASASVPGELDVPPFAIAAEWDGPDMVIAFNGHYLTDALAVMGGACSLALSDNLSPAVIRCAGKPERLAVVMPMRA